jgi:hypothetical protein
MSCRVVSCLFMSDHIFIIILYYITLHYIILYYIIIYYIILFLTILYYITPYYIILYYFILYYIHILDVRPFIHAVRDVIREHGPKRMCVPLIKCNEY